jgi:hypothetical protein
LKPIFANYENDGNMQQYITAFGGSRNRYVTPKRHSIFSRLNGVTSHAPVIFIPPPSEPKISRQLLVYNTTVVVDSVLEIPFLRFRSSETTLRHWAAVPDASNAFKGHHVQEEFLNPLPLNLKSFLDLIIFESERTTFLRNISNRLRNDAASYPRITKSSGTC